MQHPIVITGSRYVRTVPAFPLNPDADVVIDGGGLANPLTGSFTFNSRGAILMSSSGGPQKIRLTLNPPNGIVFGSFIFPNTATSVQIRGVLLQTQQIGGGCFFRNGLPGSFSITE